MGRLRGFRLGRKRTEPMTRERRLALLRKAHAESALKGPKEEFALLSGGAGTNTDSGGNNG
jgi:hypothetical protein